MKKAFISLLLIFLVAHSTLPQGYRGKGRVRGFVVDEDGNPLEGVRIKLFSLKGQEGFETVTDAGGKWVAAWIRGGKWNIEFLKVGYEPKKISVGISEVNKNPDIEIRLKKKEGLVITDELKEELERGNKLLREGSYQEAIEVYLKILEKFPDAYAISKNIGNCFFEMGKYELAQEYFEKVLEKEPDNNEMKLAIGICYANRGQSEKAMEWYNKIKFEEIDDPAVLYNLGTHFYELSKFTEALRYYKRAVEIQNDFLDGIYQWGLTHLTLGQYKEAIEVFENYLKHDPDSDRSSQVVGFIDFLKKKVEKKGQSSSFSSIFMISSSNVCMCRFHPMCANMGQNRLKIAETIELGMKIQKVQIS